MDRRRKLNEPPEVQQAQQRRLMAQNQLDANIRAAYESLLQYHAGLPQEMIINILRYKYDYDDIVRALNL